MNSFNRARNALVRIVVCFIFALLFALMPFIGVNRLFDRLFGGEIGTYLMWGLAAILLLVSAFSTVSVVGHYLDGCGDVLDTLNDIKENMESRC